MILHEVHENDSADDEILSGVKNLNKQINKIIFYAIGMTIRGDRETHKH